MLWYKEEQKRLVVLESQFSFIIFLKKIISNVMLTNTVSAMILYLRSRLQYSEMLDLEGLKSMELDCPNQKRVMPVYNLKLSTEAVQLKVMADYFFCFVLFSCLPHYGDMTKADMSALCFLDGQH